MAYAERLKFIEEIERLRNSKVLCYLTSVRQNSSANMADDAVREMFDHVLLLPARPVPQLDIFLSSNGGSGTVPWRLASLFREFAEKVAVLVPYRAYSAATMLALGADEKNRRTLASRPRALVTVRTHKSRFFGNRWLMSALPPKAAV